MGSPQSPAALEAARWGQIQICVCMYMLMVFTANCWIALSPLGGRHFSPSGTSLNDSSSEKPHKSVQHARGSAFRPELFHEQPALAQLQAAARVVDPTLFSTTSGFGGNRTYQDRSNPFVPGVKNPCWEHNGVLRCIPYFYILGAFQSGARDLQAKMRRHHEIAHSDLAEPHFWSELRDPVKFVDGYKHASQDILKNPSHVIGCVPAYQASWQVAKVGARRSSASTRSSHRLQRSLVRMRR